MKKRNFLISSLFLLAFVLIPLNLNAQENNSYEEQKIKESRAVGIFDITDDTLQKTIVDAINKDTGSTWDIDNMPEDELLKVTSIETFLKVDTLDGLDYYIQKGLLNNLTTLRLESDNNSITDISPIAGLSSLESISIHGNVEDISALSSSTGLKYVLFPDNEITDISVLSNMKELESIDFTNNKITDISALKSLTKLYEVYIGGNNISDISALSNSINMVYLHLEDNQISDISAITNMSQLEDFSANNNLIVDISPLENKANLNVAYLDGNKIYDLSPLESVSMVMAGNQNVEIDLGDFDDIEDIKLLSDEVSIFLKDGTEVKIPYGLDVNDVVNYDDYSYTVPFNQDAGFVTFNGTITVTFSYVVPIPLTPLEPSIPVTIDPSDPTKPDKVDVVDNKDEKETIGKKLIQTGKENIIIIFSFIILLISFSIIILNKRV